MRGAVQASWEEFVLLGDMESWSERGTWGEMQMNARRILLCGAAVAAGAFVLSFGAPQASAQNRDALILLGKNIFFDKQLSTPRGKQACASCHDPRVGWTLPLGNINETTVGAPGARPAPSAAGNLRTTVTSRASSANTRPAP